MFDRHFLERLGFEVVRSAGQVSLMRVELVDPMPLRRTRRERLTERLTPRLPLPRRAPAA